MILFQDTEIAALEALLFVAKEPLSIQRLAEILEIPAEDVPELIQVLKERYETPASGFTMIELEDGFRLGTKPELAGYIEVLYKQPSQTLSNAALEVLSIIAYKQPVTRGEIDFIRGVQSDRALATLVEKGLAKEIGRKDGPGRPILFGTTEDFLLHFGLRSLQELPTLTRPEEDEAEEDNDNDKAVTDTAGEPFVHAEIGEKTEPLEVDDHEAQEKVPQHSEDEIEPGDTFVESRKN